jgi:hypothetical protein
VGLRFRLDSHPDILDYVNHVEQWDYWMAAHDINYAKNHFDLSVDAAGRIDFGIALGVGPCNLRSRECASRPVSLLARIAASAAVVCLLVGAGARAQSSAQSSDGLNHDRILGVIPNYQTVNDATPATAPLTPKQKWQFFLEESRDPFNIAAAALSAGLSQADNQTPKYGEGGAAYGERFGAALGDFTSQNLFSDAILSCLLHQDPRYFRKGPKARLLPRVAYSLSRIAVARQDSGRSTFNASGVFGMMLGIGASNLYYPSVSRTGTVMATRLGTSMAGWALGNVASEFWPDIHQRFFPNGLRRRKAPQPPALPHR